MPYLCFPFTKQGWPSSMLSRWCCFWIQRDGHPPMRTTIWGLNYVQLTRGGMTRGPFIPCFDPGMCQYCIITQCLPDLVIFRDFSICIYIYTHIAKICDEFPMIEIPTWQTCFWGGSLWAVSCFFWPCLRSSWSQKNTSTNGLGPQYMSCCFNVFPNFLCPCPSQYVPQANLNKIRNDI